MYPVLRTSVARGWCVPTLNHSQVGCCACVRALGESPRILASSTLLSNTESAPTGMSYAQQW